MTYVSSYGISVFLQNSSTFVFSSFQLEKFRFRRDTSNHAIVMKVTYWHQLKTLRTMQRLTETVKLLCVTRCWRTSITLRSSETLSQNINPGHGELFSRKRVILFENIKSICLCLKMWLFIRYVVYTSKLVNSDGRVSYPMCFIFSSPKYVGFFLLYFSLCLFVCFNFSPYNCLLQLHVCWPVARCIIFVFEGAASLKWTWCMPAPNLHWSPK